MFRFGLSGAFVALVCVSMTACSVGGNTNQPYNESLAYKGAEEGQVLAVTGAVVNGMNVNKPDADGKTLLHHAVIGNQPEVVHHLLYDYDAKPNLKDKAGRTPLSYAIEGKVNDRILSELKSEGATE